MYTLLGFSEIQDNVDSLEEWLEEMENTLQPLPLNSRWSKKAINEKMKELKVSLVILLKLKLSPTCIITNRKMYRSIFNFTLYYVLVMFNRCKQ